jgi:hypothetical protein
MTTEATHHTTAVSANQNQGGSVYPFMEPCRLAGVVSDIRVTFFYGEDGLPPICDLYVMISRAGRTTPRLRFFADRAAERLILDTESLTLKHSQGSLWFFLSPDGRQTVYYSEYAGVDKMTESAECVRLIPRCWAPCNLDVGHFGNVGAGLEIIAEYPIVCDVGLTDGDFTEVVIRDDQYRPPANESLKSINAVSGNHEGNFSIHGDNQSIVVTALLALSTQVPDINDRVTERPLGVGVRHDGTVCCSCEDYAKKYKELQLLVNEHNYEIAFLNYLKEYYGILLEQYNGITKKRLGDTVQLRAAPGRKQSMFTVSVANPLAQSVFNVKIKLDVTCDEPGRTKAVYIDGAYSSGDYPSYEFIVPELKAHSQWVGSVVIVWLECGLTATGELTVGLPWLCDEKITSESRMSCELVACPPVQVPPVCPAPITPALPSPPDRESFFID